MMRAGGSEKPKTALGVRVAAAARAQRLPPKKDGAFLNRDLRFNPDLTCRNPEGLLDELLDGRRVYQREKWERDLSVLVANVVEAYNWKPKRRVSIPRDANAWSAPARYQRPRYGTVELLDRMYKKGLIDMKKGYNFKHRPGRITRIWALPELLELHPQLSAGVEVRPPAELVELRVRDPVPSRRKLLDYEDTPFTRDCRQRLARANDVNRAATITYHDGSERYEMRSYIKAIFLDDFSLYGRLHTSGCRHAQGLSKTERGTALINGKPVVEMDFSALHLHILYADKGIQYRGDPYMDVLDFLPGVAGTRLSPASRQYFRRYLKSVLLSMLNANGPVQAEQASNYWIHKHRDSLKRLDLQLRRARPYLRAFERAHKRIAHYFYSGNGLTLMNRDARMALDVVGGFSEEGIPIIPLHDGFIVQRKYDERLREAMDQTYRSHNKRFKCPIKALYPKV